MVKTIFDLELTPMRIVVALFFLFSGLTAFAQQPSSGNNNETPFDVTYQSLKVYPNPVVSNAVLEFKLLEPSRVQVTLLNILGAQVRNLVNETRNQGRQSIQFSADQLERGTYFIRLSINGDIIKTIRVAVSPR